MTNTFLDTIVKHKKHEVAAARQKIPDATLLKTIPKDRPRRSLARSLSTPDRIHIIAEIKRASPSRGVLCESIHAVVLMTSASKLVSIVGNLDTIMLLLMD